MRGAAGRCLTYYPLVAPYLFLAFVGIALGCLMRELPSLFGGVIVWRERRRYLARLRRAASTDLVDETRASVRRLTWQRFPTGNALLVQDVRTEALLRDVLTKLLVEVTDEDHVKNRRGRESNDFEFYESGLNLVLEVLEERLKTAPNAGPFRQAPGPGA
jgi:hypothetical protein